MKKIILAVMLFSVALVASAQHTTPRFPYDNHKISNGSQMISQIIYLTDAATSTDTSFISPNAQETYLIVNDGDTLNGTKVIHLADVTRSNVIYKNDNCYKLDRLHLIYRESAVAKTIKLTGSFGVAGATYTVTTGTTNGKMTEVIYLFDGANFIVQ